MKELKKFIQYYKPYKLMFFFDLFCAFLISIIDLAFPQILNYLNDHVFNQTKEVIYQSLLYLTVGLIVMYLIRAFARYYVTCQGHIMGAKMESNMRQDLFDQFERLSFSYYDKNNTGVMMSRLVSDLFDISEFAHHGPENIFISLIKIVGSFIILIMIHPGLTLLLVAVTLIMFVFSYTQNKAMRAIFMDNRKKIAGVNANLQDTLGGIRVVKSFANEELERKKFKHANELFLKSYDISWFSLEVKRYEVSILFLVVKCRKNPIF